MWMTVLLAATGCGGQTPGFEPGLLGRLRSALNDTTPDLRVTAVSGPSSAAPGVPFSVSVTVCNAGTETASTNADVFLSEDGLIQTSDVLLATRPVTLKPSQCSTLDMNVDMSVSQAGSYHLGAIVDPFDYVSESHEDNNALAGNALAVDAKPDLVLTAVAGPSRRSPYTPDSPLFVTVCNQGLASSSTNVDLFLSTDTTITRDDDLFFASVWLDALDAGECRTLGVPTNTPPEGIFYLGGIVDPFDSVPEILENNNVLASHRVAVGHEPDLVVTSVRAPASARPDRPLEVSATVCNQGFQPSYFSELAVHLSDDATVTPDDHLLGFVPVGELDSGMCTTVSVTGPVPPPTGTRYLGAFADASSSVMELYEDNNASAPRSITFGSDADLTVSLKAPTLVQDGGSFRYTATVCNQGTSLGEPTTLDILLSSDATFSDEDLVLGSAPVPQLAAGECTSISEEVDSHAPPSSYFLGARVDGSSDVPELREDNNTSAPFVFVIGHGPDLVVTSVQAPTSALPGSPFRATVTVCNQGTNPSHGSMVALKLVPLDVATPVELHVGNPFVGSLDPGSCEDIPADIFVDMPVRGAWKLLAQVDADHHVSELIESNNSASSNRIGISYSADFAITSVSGPTRLSPYGSPESFAFVTVCNHGTQSDSPHAELFLSQDSSITRDDLLIGGEPVGHLEPGQCRTATVRIDGPPSEGTFYLGARVHPAPHELFLDDNVATGNLVAIGSRADLVVTSVQAPASVRPNAHVSATATVCNQGFAPTYQSEVAVYLSQDTTVDSMQDTLVGFANVGDLDRGQCTSVTVTGQVSVPAGTHFLIAFADEAQQITELYEDNNLSAPRPLTIGNGMDLTVSLKVPSVSRSGQPLNVTATVCNQGTEPSDFTFVDVLFSPDATLSLQDVRLAGASVDPLAPGACASLPLQVQVPTESGFLGAIVDEPSNLPELREDNNTSAASALVTGLGPDLTITSVQAPTSALPGSPFDATITVCNQGFDYSPGSQLALRLTPLDVATPVDIPAGTSFVGGLAPGACEDVPASVFTDLPMYLSGAWKLLAFADFDHHVPELLESNNSASSNRIGISHSADFAITSVSGPTRLSPYGAPESFAFVTVCNHGAQSDNPHAELFLSQDSSITRDDMLVGNEPVGYLEPGQCRTANVRIDNLPPEGTFYLGARVHPAPQELFLDDNVATGNLVAIGSQPDLVVTSVQAPSSVRPFEDVSITTTVCNQGFMPAQPFEVVVRLSQDTTASPEDFILGYTHVGQVDPSACVTASLTGGLLPPPGNWFLLASADAYEVMPELYEDNNVSTPRALAIGEAPDLVVSVTAPSTLRPGDPLGVTATVCNQGTQPSRHVDVEVFLSLDTTFFPDDLLVGRGPVEPLAPGACAPLPLTVAVPSQGSWYVGAIVDRHDSEDELREDNNTSAASALVIDFGPDLTITSVSAPASALPGSPFDATITVCNQGFDHSSGSQLALRLAPLGVATPVDIPAGTTFVGGLDPGACEDVPASVYTDMPMYLSGAWKLLAFADADHHVPELLESNNSASSNRIGIGYGADFVITSVSGPTRLSPYGDPVPSAFVTICNQGTNGDSTHVELKLSQDDSISMDDPFIGSAPVEPLEPGQCRTQGVPIDSPYVHGSFYLGAHLPEGYRELFADNNTALGHRVLVGADPDLVVTSVQAPASLQPGAPLDVSATVCNTGTTPSYGSNLEVLLSPDVHVSQEEDFRAGFVHVGMLEASQCTTVRLTDPAQPPSGTWYLAALADAFGTQTELDEDNNLSDSRVLTVGMGADLTVSVDPPTSARPGVDFDVLATVCNPGTAPSQHSSVDVLLSSDETLSTTTDFRLGTAPVEPLAPGACTTLSVTTSAWQPEGTWYLGAFVDGTHAEPELREDNNASTLSAFGLGFGPDLVITSVQAPTASQPDFTFPATLEVCNQGTEPSPSTQVELKLAPQGVGSPVELPAGNASVGALAPGACASVTADVSSAVPQGTWKLLARVDANAFVPELLESNNSASSQRIGIGQAPDFVITAINAPALISPWEGATVKVTVCNQGTDFGAGAPDIGVMLSQDASITRDDAHLMSLPVNDLPPGECRTVDASVGWMPEGSFHVGAILTVWMPELFRDNNTAVGPRVIVGARPELVVSSVQGSAIVQGDQVLTSAVNVCNQGFDFSNPTHVEVRLAGQEPESLLVGQATVAELEPGHCQTLSVASTTPLPSGTYTLEAVVDPHNQVWELLEDNNRKTGHTVTVTN
jgi:subtilase family serine protease